MTEMRYELAIERIENIKGENTVSEKYRDYFRTLADFALLVDKLKEKIEIMISKGTISNQSRIMFVNDGSKDKQFCEQ